MNFSVTFQIYLYFLCTILLVIGGLNWGLIGTYNMNLVKLLNEKTFNSTVFENTIYTLVGIAAIYLGTKKHFYLPFLGRTVMAPSVIRPAFSNDKATINLVVDAPNAESVIYWAAEPLNNKENEGKKFAYDAYDKYNNSGVANVENGKALLKIQCPQTYWVRKFGVKKTLPKHLHYRLVYPKGMLSEVYTLNISC